MIFLSNFTREYLSKSTNKFLISQIKTTSLDLIQKLCLFHLLLFLFTNADWCNRNRGQDQNKKKRSSRLARFKYSKAFT